MIVRRRVLLLALLALAVPFPALALTGGGDEAPAPVDIAVSASLDSCGTASSTIVCKIDASWDSVPGATRYTASVTRADGSVVDFGEVGAGGSSFWVPYVGNGTYSVQVLAYGTAPESGAVEVIAKGTSRTDDDTQDFGGEPAAGTEQDFSAGEPDDGTTDPGDDGEQTPPDTEPLDPDCDEPVEPPEDPATTDPTAPEADDPAALDAEAAAALDESAEAPESVECPPPPPAG